MSNGAVTRIRGDREDVFSHGYICPKGSTLRQLHEDPDRLRQPLIKRDGVHVEVSWDEAFAEIEARLLPVIEAHGRDAVGTYVGQFLGPLIHRARGEHVSGTQCTQERLQEQQARQIVRVGVADVGTHGITAMGLDHR